EREQPTTFRTREGSPSPEDAPARAPEEDARTPACKETARRRLYPGGLGPGAPGGTVCPRVPRRSSRKPGAGREAGREGRAAGGGRHPERERPQPGEAGARGGRVGACRPAGLVRRGGRLQRDPRLRPGGGASLPGLRAAQSLRRALSV
ncbi:MAG: hypothetical protein AVDCRST_MAG78-3348, partial [uncultured Rubrobacteraceae bacterium]